MTGRRPNRSDSAPCTGENTNCISAQTDANRPTNSEARAVSPARKPSIRLRQHRDHHAERQHVEQHGDEDEREGGLAPVWHCG
jgi:hypothetical protein